MEKNLQKSYYNCLFISQTWVWKGYAMTYNIIDIVDKDLTDAKLKEIINKKLYKIIELLEFNVNYSE